MRRSLPVTLLALIVLSLSVWNGLRSYAAGASWDLLTELGATPGPLYIFLTGLFWTATGLIVFRGLWLGRTWARKATWLYVALYLTQFWADRVLYRTSERMQNLVLILVIQLIFLGLTAWALLGPRPNSFFR